MCFLLDREFTREREDRRGSKVNDSGEGLERRERVAPLGHKGCPARVRDKAEPGVGGKAGRIHGVVDRILETFVWYCGRVRALGSMSGTLSRWRTHGRPSSACFLASHSPYQSQVAVS